MIAGAKITDDTESILSLAKSLLLQPDMIADLAGITRIRRDTSKQKFTWDHLGITVILELKNQDNPFKGVEAEVEIKDLSVLVPYTTIGFVKFFIVLVGGEGSKDSIFDLQIDYELHHDHVEKGKLALVISLDNDRHYTLKLDVETSLDKEKQFVHPFTLTLANTEFNPEFSQIEGSYTDQDYHGCPITIKKLYSKIFLIVEHPENKSNIIEFEFDMQTFSSRLYFDSHLHYVELLSVYHKESIQVGGTLLIHQLGGFTFNLDVSNKLKNFFFHLKIGHNGQKILSFHFREIPEYLLNMDEYQAFEIFAGTDLDLEDLEDPEDLFIDLPLLRIALRQEYTDITEVDEMELFSPIFDSRFVVKCASTSHKKRKFPNSSRTSRLTSGNMPKHSLHLFAEMNQKRHFELNAVTQSEGEELERGEITVELIDFKSLMKIKFYTDYYNLTKGLEVEASIDGLYLKPLLIEVNQKKIIVSGLTGLDGSFDIDVERNLRKFDISWGGHHVNRISGRKQLSRNINLDVYKVNFFTSNYSGRSGSLMLVNGYNKVKVFLQELETDLKVSLEVRKTSQDSFEIDGFGTVFGGSPLFKWNSHATVQNNGIYFSIVAGGNQSFNIFQIELSESFELKLDMNSLHDLYLQGNLSSNIFPSGILKLNTLGPYQFKLSAPMPDQTYLDIDIDPATGTFMSVMSGIYSPDSFEVEINQKHFVLKCDPQFANFEFTLDMPDNSQIEILSNPADGNILSIKSNNFFGFESLEIVTEGEWKNLVLNGLNIATYQYCLFEKHVSIEMYGVVANVNWDFAPYYRQGRLNTFNVDLSAKGVSISSNLTMDLSSMILEIEETISIPQLPAISPIKAKIKGELRQNHLMKITLSTAGKGFSFSLDSDNQYNVFVSEISAIPESDYVDGINPDDANSHGI